MYQIQHVILADFPSSPVDYLHRIGRTGRMGKRGLWMMLWFVDVMQGKQQVF